MVKKIAKKDQLHIGILDYTELKYGSKSNKEIRELRRAIKDRGHKPIHYKVGKCQMFFSGKNFEILYNNKSTKGVDVLVPRAAILSDVDLEVSLIKQFQLLDVPVINGYLPVLRAKNKLRTMQILTKKGISVPKTVVTRKLEYLDDAIKKIGGYPCIIKTCTGSYGAGVVIVESRRSLYSALDALWVNSKSNIIMIQEYVAEATGADYRAFVIGDKVVAAMKRQAQPGEFRSNLELGGEASIADLSLEEQKVAVKATKALGLQIGGVDMLLTSKGPMIMEVNANPGFKGISDASGIDIAMEIVKYTEKFMKAHAEKSIKNGKSVKKPSLSKSSKKAAK
ncbi:RimK family alpha-L-glutamate ligase [Candidatus Peregrinibacteria bacterium]|nr:RimK family alpha-L-glutamate ligase [Candidatus Peregrinibacteria bacterium]